MMQNSFISKYADIQYYMKNNFVTHYGNYADFQYQIYFHHWLRWPYGRYTAHEK